MFSKIYVWIYVCLEREYVLIFVYVQNLYRGSGEVRKSWKINDSETKWQQ